jgi:hypothetical protein
LETALSGRRVDRTTIVRSRDFRIYAFSAQMGAVRVLARSAGQQGSVKGWAPEPVMSWILVTVALHAKRAIPWTAAATRDFATFTEGADLSERAARARYRRPLPPSLAVGPLTHVAWVTAIPFLAGRGTDRSAWRSWGAYVRGAIVQLSDFWTRFFARRSLVVAPVTPRLARSTLRD